MATMGQRILERLDAVEVAVTNLQLDQPRAPDQPAVLRQLEELRSQFRDEVAAMREQLDRNPPPGRNNTQFPTRGLFNPKDCLPEVLSHDYKQKWRVWAYKARDWLAQIDESLGPKLEAIEN